MFILSYTKNTTRETGNRFRTLWTGQAQSGSLISRPQFRSESFPKGVNSDQEDLINEDLGWRFYPIAYNESAFLLRCSSLQNLSDKATSLSSMALHL